MHSVKDPPVKDIKRGECVFPGSYLVLLNTIDRFIEKNHPEICYYNAQDATKSHHPCT